MKRKYMIAAAILLCSATVQAQEPMTLERCRQMALENNKQIRTAEAAQDKAAYDAKAYKANFFPKFSASGNYLYTNSNMSYTLPGAYLPTFIPDPANPGSLLPNILTEINGTPIFKEYAYFPDMTLDFDLNGTWSAGIKAEQPVYMGGKIGAAHKASKIGEEIAGLNSDLTRLEVIILTDEVYWTCVKTTELLKTALKYREVVQELLRNIEDAVDAGMKSRNELLKVQVKYNEAELKVFQVENGLRLARMNLCHVIGLPLETGVELPGDFDGAEITVTTDNNISARPEYGMLAKQVELKEQQKRVVQGDFLPEVGVMAGLNYGYGVKFNGSPLMDNTSLSAMASIKIPIFHWGEGRNKVRSADLEKQIAVLQHQDMSEKMELELTQSINLYHEAKLEAQLTSRSVEQAEENLKISRDHYDAGMETLANYLEAQTSWQSAHTDMVNAKAAMRLSETRYLKAAGKL